MWVGMAPSVFLLPTLTHAPMALMGISETLYLPLSYYIFLHFSSFIFATFATSFWKVAPKQFINKNLLNKTSNSLTNACLKKPYFNVFASLWKVTLLVIDFMHCWWYLFFILYAKIEREATGLINFHAQKLGDAKRLDKFPSRDTLLVMSKRAYSKNTLLCTSFERKTN